MRKVISLLLALAMVFALVGCGSTSVVQSVEAQTAEADGSQQEKAEETKIAAAYVDWTKVNTLTGEPTEKDYSNTRPVAVMLNTFRQALPQSGNSQADVLYEVPEEGGVTRVMAVYQDISDVGTLGTIRSTRPYYVRLALSNDAILVHAGGSGAAYRTIKEYMEEYNFDDMDCLSKGTNEAYTSFYRDSYRLSAGYSLEHTLYTNSENILKYFEENPDKVQTTHRKHFCRTHAFTEDGTPTVGAMTANSIDVKFSGYKSTGFSYNETTGTYDVTAFESAYMDAASGNQVSVENVIVILTDIVQLNDAKQHVAVTLNGTGTGYFACNGKLQKITWSKDKARHTYEFYDEEGNEVLLGVGKSYVCIVDKSRPITVDGVEQEKPADSTERTDLADSEMTTDEEENEDTGVEEAEQ